MGDHVGSDRFQPFVLTQCWELKTNAEVESLTAVVGKRAFITAIRFLTLEKMVQCQQKVK